MTKYLCWTEKTETWRGKPVDRHIIDKFNEHYDLVYDSVDYIVDPDAVVQFALAADKGDYDLIYCDEDIIKENERQEPFFKPDYSPETQRSLGYINGLIAVKKGTDRKDLSSFERDRVYHIPKVLYHRGNGRAYDKVHSNPQHGSYKGSSVRPVMKDDQAAEDKKNRIDEGNDHFFIDKFDHMISIIILSKDHPEMLERCIDSIKLSLCEDAVEIILVDNGSSYENKIKYEKLTARLGVRYFYNPVEFNYSLLNNYGASKASGDVLIFMNDDIEIPSNVKGVLEKLTIKAVEEKVGAVGLKLLYPDEERIQHCGVTLLFSGPSHKLQGYLDDSYYFGYSERDINTIAVTGACLAISRANYEAINGFDENLPVAYNDVDLCMRLYKKGLYNVCLNSEHLIHYESVTRPDDRNDRKSFERLKEERNYFYSKHADIIEAGDPFLSPNITHYGLDFDINLPEEWEMSGISELLLTKAKEKISDRVKASLDTFDYRLADAYGNQDFFEISGWIFKEGKKNLKPAVILKTDRIRYEAKASRTERKDVADVFPKEKYSRLSGFIARIPAEVMENIKVDGKVTAYPVLKGKWGGFYKSKEDCQKTREL